MSTQQILTGHAVAPGIAIGHAVVGRSQRSAHRGKATTQDYEPMYARTTSRELDRLQYAIDMADAGLAAAETQLKAEGQIQEATAFGIQRMLLTEPALRDRALALIVEDSCLAADAILQAGEEQVHLLAESGEQESIGSAHDIRAVVGQVWRMLTAEEKIPVSFQEPVILIAEDIGPSDLMQLPRDKLLGLALARGGLTAHAAILVRAWNIPAVIGLGSEMLQQVRDGMLLALDGTQGELVLMPDEETMERLRQTADGLALHQQELRSQRDQPSTTRDGHHITLLSNVSSLAGAQAARDWGAAGIGSLRTELLFVGQTIMPDEDTQVQIYLDVAAELPDMPIVARTLDIGGDKQIPSFPLPREDNPFLGWRGIRIGLSRPHELLLPQLRAMLRAGATTDIRIVAPMIATMQEWRQFRALFEQAHAELRAAGIACAEQPKIGVLIEVPAAALIVEHLAREADFLSIGSNDLIQYTLACDRTNPRVASIYQPLEPAILHLLHTIIQAAHRHGRKVSLCGEMASDPLLTPLLIGLGIDELSCTPPALPAVRAAVRTTSAAEAQQLAHAALQAVTLDEVRALVEARRASDTAPATSVQP